ncbi:MAG: Dyp-type peroxidase [Chthoniobacterales bacterium]
MSEVDYSDVQGLLRFGFGKMKEATYALLRVRNAAAARAWLRSAPVTSAEAMAPPPSTALQVAFTAAGLTSLGVSPSVIANFSPEFVTGMTEASRTRRLGDTGTNAPETWEWGYENNVPHLVVMFFAEPGRLAGFMQNAKGANWNDAFEEIRWLQTGDLGGIEPFGFADGISQPQIDWERQRDVTETQLDYSNIAALGEFLLGYPNEYNKYNDRPLLDADAKSAELLPAEDAPEKKDLARNGTYMVIRQLRQDVRKFWQFIYERSGGNADEADKLGAAFVGRTRAGQPLVPIQSEPIPGIDPKDAAKNQFTFAQNTGGARCPFGAHIHRANPRNADFEGRPTGLRKLITMLGFGPRGFRDDLMSPVRFHRILRRGREYGPELKPEDALTPSLPDEPERGLQFVCLNANITRQFEFLQNAWIMNTKFSGMTNESDALLGNREKFLGCPITGEFTIPQSDGAPRHIKELPQFVTVRGGAYFFLPSLRALRFFATE